MKLCGSCGKAFEEDRLEFCPYDGARLQIAPSSRSDLDLAGRLIDDRFAVAELLGKGAMGAVFRATQTSVGRQVALKVLPAEGANLERAQRFMLEARTTSSLRNVHTVTIFDFGQTSDGTLYLAMELLEGEDLAARLWRLQHVPWRKALQIVDQVAESLEEAHAKGIVHRDLKPGNIFLTRMGSEPDFVKVLDFGIAKLQGELSPDLTNVGAIIGTPAYMSPEQARGQALDPRADLYALGAVLFEMLTGRPPFSADTSMNVILMHCQTPAPSVAELAPGIDVPDGVERLVRQLLAKDPDGRTPSALHLRAQIGEILAGGRGPARPSASARAPRPGWASATSSRRRAPLVGRDGELDELFRAARVVEALGRLMVVPVIGPAGSGKTRLLSEFSQRLAEAGLERWDWDAAHCTAADGLVGFEPLTGALLEAEDDDEIGFDESATTQRQHVELSGIGALSEVEVALLEEQERLLDGLSPAASLRWDDAVAVYVDRIRGGTGHQPMILLIEDLQWASPGALELLARVAERCLQLPLLLIVTVRSEVAGGVLAALRPMAARTRSVHLLPLDSIETAELVRRLSGLGDLPGPLIASIEALAEGIPRRIVEAVDGLSVDPEGGWGTDEEVGAAEVTRVDADAAEVLQQLSSLPAADQSLLYAMSAAGSTWTYLLLGAILQRSVDAADVERLASAGFDVGDAGTHPTGAAAFAFHHPAVEEYARAATPPEVLRTFHARAAGWLATWSGDRRGGFDALLEAHVGGAGGALEVARHLIEAAREERGRDERRAAELFERAASFGEAGGEDDAADAAGFAARVGAAECLVRLGDHAAARDAVAQALARHEISEPIERARALCVLGEALVALDRRDKAFDAFSRAARLGDEAAGLGVYAMGWTTQLYLHEGKIRDARMVGRLAVAAAEKLEPDEHVQRGLGAVYVALGEIECRERELGVAAELFAAAREHLLAVREVDQAARAGRVADLIEALRRAEEAEEPSEALTLLEASRPVCEELDFALGSVLVSFGLARVFGAEGRHAEALACLDEARDVATDDRFDEFIPEILLATARINLADGNDTAATAAAEKAAVWARQLERPHVVEAAEALLRTEIAQRAAAHRPNPTAGWAAALERRTKR